MDPIDLCEARALQPFVNCLERRGVQTERYLERRLLSPERVAEGSSYFVKRQAWGFFDDVIRREDIGALGFLDGDVFSAGDLGSLGACLQGAVTLKDAIDTFARLVSVYAQGNTVSLESGTNPESDRVWLTCRTDRLDPEAFVPDDHTVLVLASLVRLATGEDWRPLALRFQTIPSERRGVSGGFADIETEFDQRGSAVAFPKRLLSWPIWKKETGSRPSTRLDPLPSQTHAAALGHLLRSLLPFNALPTSQQAAEMIGVSRRTLYRALESEGIAYRHLVDRARFENARSLLSKTGIGLETIARESGYSGPNNFIRAFRRFTGCTPGEFRRRCRES